MKAAEDYKKMLFDVSRLLCVFDDYANAYKSWVEQPTKETEMQKNYFASVVGQWSVDDVELVRLRIMGYNPKYKIEQELTGDEPDNEKLKTRLKWTFIRLGVPGDDDSCFPQWDGNYNPPSGNDDGNKFMFESLAALQGKKYAFDVMWRLHMIAFHASFVVSEVEAFLHDLCKLVGYDPQEPQKEPQEQRKGDGLTTTQNNHQQAVGGQQIGNNEPQQEQHKTTRGKGRPKETLKDKMVNDADGGKLHKIHDIWGHSKGKDAALIIVACIKLGWMMKPTYAQVKNEFGEIGSKTGYNRYLNSKMFTDDEIWGVMNILKQT